MNIKKIVLFTTDQYFSSIYFRISRANLNVLVFKNHPNFTQMISLNCLLSVFLMKNQTSLTEIIKHPKSNQKLYIV